MAVPRPVVMLGAPSNIGIRPYDDGRLRQLDRAPAVLRGRALARRLGAEDLGDVRPPPYEDVIRPPAGVRNERGLVEYSARLAERVAQAGAGGRFVVLLGGDCSIVLGAVAGARRTVGGPVGLAYVDAHADFATPQESVTGSAASMCLAMAVGRGDSPLARLGGRAPLVHPRDVVLLGRRDEGEPYGHNGLRELGVPDVPYARIRRLGAAWVAEDALAVLGHESLGGFWIHLDADVLDAATMPAVDSPTPEGPDVEALLELVGPLVGHPRALGLQVTIYDPGLDPDGVCAERLAELLERLAPSHSTLTAAAG
jgi:arginase